MEQKVPPFALTFLTLTITFLVVLVDSLFHIMIIIIINILKALMPFQSVIADDDNYVCMYQLAYATPDDSRCLLRNEKKQKRKIDGSGGGGGWT